MPIRAGSPWLSCACHVAFHVAFLRLQQRACFRNDFSTPVWGVHQDAGLGITILALVSGGSVKLSTARGRLPRLLNFMDRAFRVFPAVVLAHFFAISAV